MGPTRVSIWGPCLFGLSEILTVAINMSVYMVFANHMHHGSNKVLWQLHFPFRLSEASRKGCASEGNSSPLQ